MRIGIAAVLLGACAFAFAQDTDVGIVNRVAGAVSYAPASGGTGKVQAFMRVREGDRFDLAAGAELGIVFTEGGRLERWRGPASFRAAQKSSVPLSGSPAEVSSVPAGAPQRIARVPELVRIAQLGGIQVRGLTPRQQASLDQQEVLRDARVTYAQMRKDLPADDITPELYLYSVLHDFLLYDEMKDVVAEMRRRQPDNDAITPIENWLKSKASEKR
jgi:hypothetical protein